MQKNIILHLNPIWRDRANFIIHAKFNLNENGHTTVKLEQIWSQQLSENRFRVCCIPFFTYGLALGDIVETSPSDGMQYIIYRVVEKSGHSTIRVSFQNDDESVHSEILNGLGQDGILLEYYSKHLLGVDLSSDRMLEDVMSFLATREQSGDIFYETG